MTTENFIPYGRQSIEPEDIEAVTDALLSPVITRGERVDAFEKAVASYTGVKHAISFSSGATALLATCHAIQVSKDDIVITTPNTFVATFAAPWLHGARPYFADIDKKSGNLSLEAVANLLERFRKPGQRAVILPVHFSGIPVDTTKLRKLLQEGDMIIEDAAHALGSKLPDGSKVGSCKGSDMAIFSFHPVKTITTGEGGMVTTNDDSLAQRIRRFKNSGIERDPDYMEANPGPWHYEVHDISLNYNMNEMQGALGLSQMKKLEAMVRKRRSLVDLYRQCLQELPGVELFDQAYDAHTSYHIFVTQIDFARFRKTRREVMEELYKKGIGSQVHYIPLYHHPALKRIYGDIASHLPETESYFEKALTLPLFYHLKEEQVPAICQKLQHILCPLA
ncbi:MAG: uncharacterized protein K0S07_1306 [Chlamydiales bacterium]|jgi:dTDP-4-amino-4,6-dideoxygalactose transaminase|nr:uncharacterized protein [Chlamydiales bacterium]